MEEMTIFERHQLSPLFMANTVIKRPELPPLRSKRCVVLTSHTEAHFQNPAVSVAVSHIRLSRCRSCQSARALSGQPDETDVAPRPTPPVISWLPSLIVMSNALIRCVLSDGACVVKEVLLSV